MAVLINSHAVPTTTRALVLDGVDCPFVLRDVVIDDPRENEVLVRMVATGLCHSDLGVQTGALPGIEFPIVLGHEGAGVIEKVGPGVTALKVNDSVLLSFNSCGGCRTCIAGSPAVCTNWLGLNFSCPRGSSTSIIGHEKAGGREIRGLFFGQSSFSGHSIVSVRSCVKVAKAMDLVGLSPLGCGIQTGAGTVLNGLKAKSGNSIGIWGLGGVGMAAILAAVAQKCSPVIAVDLVPSRLATAKFLGATHVINGGDADLVDQITSITDGKGLDFTVDAAGSVHCIAAAIECLGIGGKHAQVGVIPPGVSPVFDVQDFIIKQKSFCGFIEGASDPAKFIPQLAEMCSSPSAFSIASLTKSFSLEDFQKAIDAMHDGSVIKPIITFATAPKL